MNWRPISILMGGVIIGAATTYFLFQNRDKSYEECMVSEMRGQPYNIATIIDKICSRRFGRLVYVPKYEVAMEWLSSDLDTEIIIVSNEYEVVQGTFKVSKNSCEESKIVWDEPLSAYFVDGIAEVKGPLKCVKAITLWGRYKK